MKPDEIEYWLTRRAYDVSGLINGVTRSVETLRALRKAFTLGRETAYDEMTEPCERGHGLSAECPFCLLEAEKAKVAKLSEALACVNEWLECDCFAYDADAEMMHLDCPSHQNWSRHQAHVRRTVQELP